MKILIVNKFLYPNGGSETYIFNLGNQLKTQGHEVQYFGMEHEGRIVGNRVGAYTSDMDFHGGAKLSKLTYPIKTIYSSIKLVKETISPLLGEMPDENFIKKLKDKILSYEGILGVHDFLIHSYGPNTYFASAHAEVSSKADIMKTHDIIDNIEKDFKELFNIVLSIHMDPIDVDNEEVNFNKKKVEIILKNIDERITFHDFRLVIGKTHTNILFDVVVPFDCEVSLEEVKKVLEDKYKDEDKKYFFIIELDRI